MSERPDPTEDVRRLYEDAEKRTADAMEELVKRDAFGELLARATENILAVDADRQRRRRPRRAQPAAGRPA